MIEINVTVKAPELAEAIQSLAAALNNRSVAPSVPDAQPVEVSNATQTQTQEKEDTGAPWDENPTTPASVNPAATAQTGPAQTTSHSETIEPPSIAVLSTAGARLCEQGKMPQLIALLGKYGVKAVTQLKGVPADTLMAFAADLKALGAEI